MQILGLCQADQYFAIKISLLHDIEALQVTPAEFTGHEEVVRLQHHKREDSSVEINFEFRKQRYCYDEDEHTFRRLHFPDKVEPTLSSSANLNHLLAA